MGTLSRGDVGAVRRVVEPRRERILCRGGEPGIVMAAVVGCNVSPFGISTRSFKPSKVRPPPNLPLDQAGPFKRVPV